jgi:hypothetical protein
MATPPPGPDSDGTGVPPGGGPAAGMPRWVKVCALIAAVVAVLFVVLMLTGGPGAHGPGRHAPPAGSAAAVPSSGGPAFSDLR